MGTEPAAIRALGRLVDLAIILGGIAIAIIVFGNVISRYVFNFDVAWSNELAVFLFVWTTFLGGAAASRRGAHLAVTEVIDLAAGRSRLAIEVAIQLVVAMILLLMTWYGAVIARANWEQTMTVLYWPVGIQYAAMPAGGVLMLVFVLDHLRRRIRARS